MKYWQAGSVSLILMALIVTGCAKKSAEQASITGAGLDSNTTSTEELAQLPPQAPPAGQPAGPEALPVEASPVTQAAPPIVSPTPKNPELSSSSAALSREQQIQTSLKNAGFYNGAIDGKIGPASKRAIEAFQKKNKLKADGKVGPKTWAALESYLNGSGPTESPAPADSTANADQ